MATKMICGVSAYNPETDGVSEQTNKTVNQALQYHVEHNQTGWVCDLLHVHFNMMTMINKSTGFTPFQICFRHSPRVIPPLPPAKQSATVADINAWHVIQKLEVDVLEAQDNLLKAKISQSRHANKHCTLKFPFTIGSRVRLSCCEVYAMLRRSLHNHRHGQGSFHSNS